MSSREHDALRESLGVLALGKLDGHERRAVLEHAGECPECGAELDDFLEVAALLWPGPVREPGPVTVRARELTV